MGRIKHPYGTVVQSSNRGLDSDYVYQDFPYLCLGVVLNVYPADSRNNTISVAESVNTKTKTSSDESTKLIKGSTCVADVLIVQDKKINSWVARQVVVLPRGSSGFQNFHEEFPRPSTLNVTGSDLDLSMARTNPLDLDGDFCVIGFIGGHIDRGVMLSWYPHPRNKFDPATSGQNDYLNQLNRYFKRVNGIDLIVTPEGNIYVNTNKANYTIESYSERKPNLKDQGGNKGSIQIDLKSGSQLEFNFNPTVELKDTESSLPQTNPPEQGSVEDRGTDKTKVNLTEDEINMIAGKLIKLMTNEDNIEILAKKILKLKGQDEDSKIEINNDITVESKTGSIISLNGTDHPLPKFDTFLTGLQTMLTQLSAGLSAGTQGSPVFHQLVLLGQITSAISSFIAEFENYKSTKVKNG